MKKKILKMSFKKVKFNLEILKLSKRIEKTNLNKVSAYIKNEEKTILNNNFCF